MHGVIRKIKIKTALGIKAMEEVMCAELKNIDVRI
jgi:hypothetical protein